MVAPATFSKPKISRCEITEITDFLGFKTKPISDSCEGTKRGDLKLAMFLVYFDDEMLVVVTFNKLSIFFITWS